MSGAAGIPAVHGGEEVNTYHYVATRNLWRSVDSTQASFTTPTPACI
jgi:hypothetical protein